MCIAKTCSTLAGVSAALQVLLLLKDVLDPSVRLYLNPQLELTELPLKSYYRCVGWGGGQALELVA
jgi:hypothetical protein